MQNKIMLITYANSLGKNLEELNIVMNRYFEKAFGGIHILPFYPSSADRGFSPMTYKMVDPEFGDYDDLSKLGLNYELMYDFMINHISKSSDYFKDFIEKKEKSPYYDYFIKYSEFWDNGQPTQDQIDKIYKRSPKAPYVDVTFADGSQDKLWCTFDKEQIDLDVRKDATKNFIKDNLEFLCKNGASLIRADAFAYVTKKANTNCFFIEPNVWDILEFVKSCTEKYNVEILPEIHEHYSIQKKISDKDYYVYDFHLPMIVLYTLYSGINTRLKEWLSIAPRKQYTTLDTHDGIGVVDVKDLLTDEEIEYTKEALYTRGANVKAVYNSTKYNNLDIYQINCTYYSALGDNDEAYLLSRAIQFFSPGIPQVYYVGLLAGKNDIELLEKTKHGRDINRHNYSLEEIDKEVNKDVVRQLLKLMIFRNEYKAFNGQLIIHDTPKDQLHLSWQYEDYACHLKADLKSYKFSISYRENNDIKLLEL